MRPMNCCIVVLAAGAGTRFQGAGHKLDGRLGDASVLARTLHNALSTDLRVLLVISRRLQDAMTDRLPDCDRVVVDPDANPGWGMADSIAAGVARSRDAAGWLVLPGDMPFVCPDSIVRVSQGLREHAVAQARHDGRRGHPVAFRSELRDDLLALTGDEGARSVVARHAGIAVDLDDPGVLQDIDTLADLAAARRRLAAG
jgi:molybdenum cofactor cytidylyltransferase